MLAAHLRFEFLVAELMAVNGFKVLERHVVVGGAEFDLIVDRGGRRSAVEIKFYRTPRAQAALLMQAAARLVRTIAIADRGQRLQGILAVSCFITSELRDSIRERYGVSVVGRRDLIRWAGNAPEVADEVLAMLDGEWAEAATSDATDEAEDLSGGQVEVAPPPDDAGSQLCARLRALKAGSSTWKKFENLSQEILKHLFPNDLHGWHPQKRTDDKLNRFDCVCRVKPTTEFWSFVAEDLGSRYVVFEFKNYKSPIKQGQILSTEKYLLQRGLRSVAIILARAGDDRGSMSTRQGAMREAGKLIIVLSDNQLCEMLHMRDRGEDPSDFMFDYADDFLLRLPR